jgi:OOP family OmpA-OmpF porin
LDDVVQILQENPELAVRIEGHTDADGEDDYNLSLSDQRAKSVMAYLVEHGVAAERLSAKGYGELRPVAPNDTEDGKAKNRRVDFMIVE